MLLYRLGKTEHARKLNGFGARDYGGRWNSVGNAMVYTSASSSTTVLEVRVHTKKIRRNLSMTTIEVPDTSSILTIQAKDLPPSWKWMSYKKCVRAVGDRFLKEEQYLILRIPSAVDTKAWNYLLNPLHPEMPKVKVVMVEPYSLDPRLFLPKK